MTLNARDARSFASHRRTAAPKASQSPQLGAAASAKIAAKVSARSPALALPPAANVPAALALTIQDLGLIH